jgi:hypothetical protein
VYASVLRHLGLSAVVSSALAAAIAVSGLSPLSATAPASAPADQVRILPETTPGERTAGGGAANGRRRGSPPVPSAAAPCTALISSVKICLQFDGKPFH